VAPAEALDSRWSWRRDLSLAVHRRSQGSHRVASPRIGYERPIKPNLALDLQLRGGTGFYDKDPVDGYVVKGHSVGFGAALSWY